MNAAVSPFKWTLRFVLLYVLFLVFFMMGAMAVAGVMPDARSSEPGLVPAAIDLLIIALAIGCPIVEMADSWDHTAQDGNDVDGSIVVVALCVGIAFACMGSSLARVRPLPFACAAIAVLVTVCAPPPAAALPIPSARPPSILRI